MGRVNHMAGKRFFRGGKCHVYGTGEKEGGRRGWERQEERWARAASGASPPWSLAKLIRAGRSCRRQRDAGADVGVDVEEAGKSEHFWSRSHPNSKHFWSIYSVQFQLL